MKRRIFQTILTLMIFSCAVSVAVAQQSDKQIEAKIYLQKTLINPNGATSEQMTAVKRKVDAKSPLRSTLEWLFAPNITAQEDKENFSSSTFGMKFEGVNLKNGTAIVRFSQPPNETNYGSLGAAIFAEAVEKTAKQFSSVRRVRLCAVGETMIDSELEKPFPRCPK